MARGRGAGMADRKDTDLPVPYPWTQQDTHFTELSRCGAALENELLEDMPQHPAQPWVSLMLPEDRGFLIPPGFMEAAWGQGMLTRGHKGPENRVTSLEEPKANRKDRKSPQMTIIQSTVEKHHGERSQQVPWKNGR